MNTEFQKVIHHLIGDRNRSGSAGFSIGRQLREGPAGGTSIFRRLNAAFLVLLAGESHPDYGEARSFFDHPPAEPSLREAVQFYREALRLISKEVEERVSADPEFSDSLKKLSSRISGRGTEPSPGPDQDPEGLWPLFFPEAPGNGGMRAEEVKRLREKRKVRLERLNSEAVSRPADEILFASNILLTLPPESKAIENLPLKKELREGLKQAAAENQLFWYDHPIPIGVEPENNEALYGLNGLSEALRYERERGVVKKDSRLSCVLSVSVTHKGLQSLARDYLEEVFHTDGGIRGVDAYIFTEIEADRLMDEVFSPAAEKYLKNKNPSVLREIFGTDGEYGRHYSFLKAISALWQVFIDPEIKATFKFDLDQVFPQKELVDQTGASAFEHFKTPLWGAAGIDYQGREVELGMLAGALVNRKDIHRGVFTPDVAFPSGIPEADERVFFSRLPQALSTEAEMMTRYGKNGPDGKKVCIQRIHVTGGTTGILVGALRKYRPFTPGFIGRAEDQAYLLSVLFSDSGPALRYAHKDGLIMRHDKEAMAAGAIRAAATGKLIGDYVRILAFSSYARALPWTLEDIKEAVDPFTGCFISKIPVTVVSLRCALKAASFFEAGNPEADLKGREFLGMAAERLLRAFREAVGEPNPLVEFYKREKEGWDLYYDLLDIMERELKRGDPFTAELREIAREIVGGCKIEMG